MFMHTEQQTLVVPPRFHGLPGLAHGGYVAGVLADALGTRGAEVRLRRPVPVDHPLRLERAAAAVELREGETLLARATPNDLVLVMPQPVSFAGAEAAAGRFPGHAGHLFPACLGCGPDHADGLRLFPGPVP